MKKVAARKIQKPFVDFASWNFIVFLTLAFILIVTVALAMGKEAKILRAKAGLACPEITTLPRPEDCQGGQWTYTRDSQGCQTFVCPASE